MPANPLADDREPWARQPKEPALAYATFQVAMELPPKHRNAARIASETGASLPSIRGWSPKWHWRERWQRWDDEQARARREAFTAETIEMGRRQAEDAQAMQEALMLFPRELMRRVGDPTTLTTEEIRAMPLSDIIAVTIAVGRVIDKPVAIERTARGIFVEHEPEQAVREPNGEQNALDKSDHNLAVLSVLEGLGVIALPPGTVVIGADDADASDPDADGYLDGEVVL